MRLADYLESSEPYLAGRRAVMQEDPPQRDHVTGVLYYKGMRYPTLRGVRQTEGKPAPAVPPGLYALRTLPHQRHTLELVNPDGTRAGFIHNEPWDNPCYSPAHPLVVSDHLGGESVDVVHMDRDSLADLFHDLGTTPGAMLQVLVRSDHTAAH